MSAYFPLSATNPNSLPVFDSSWVIAGSLAAIYFAPALVAFFRREQNRWFILALNFLFGWTIAGWIICLAWAASAPSGEPALLVQTVPQTAPGRGSFFRRGPRSNLILPNPKLSENALLRAEEFFPGRPRVVLFRLAVAAISLAVVAGVTASQWKDTKQASQPKHRTNRIPQIRNIDPYMPSPPGAWFQRRYPSPAARSHEGYY
jgi:Superinfection immunity protein